MSNEKYTPPLNGLLELSLGFAKAAQARDWEKANEVLQSRGELLNDMRAHGFIPREAEREILMAAWEADQQAREILSGHLTQLEGAIKKLRAMKELLGTLSILEENVGAVILDQRG